MSQIRVDDIVGENGVNPVDFSQGINAAGIITAASFTGTASSATNATQAYGLTGTPDITINNLTGVAATFTGAVSYEDVTNVDSTGIVTAGKGFRATAGGVVVTAGITTVKEFDATGTLVEAFSSTTTAWSSTNTLNITNGNVQFCSAVLGGTTNTLNIISTTGINTDLSIGQNLSVTGITSVNAATAYVNALTIDGIGTKVWWTGGSAPSDGGSGGMDLYTFNIMKIGSAQFYVIGTQTKTS